MRYFILFMLKLIFLYLYFYVANDKPLKPTLQYYLQKKVILMTIGVDWLPDMFCGYIDTDDIDEQNT